MTIALKNNRIEEASGNGIFRRNMCNLGFLDQGDRPMMMMKMERQNERSDVCSTSSSSIGKNSDDDDDEEEEGEDEIQSKLKETNPFDSAIGVLEQALPIRRGISEFYNGKSKSFASLGDVTRSSSMKEIAKPENAYSRKRKNLLAYSLHYDKSERSSVLKTPGIGGGIAKRHIPSSRSTLGLAVAMSHYNGGVSDKNGGVSQSASPTRPPPLHPSSWRSFSLVDLQQHCGVSVNGVKSNLGCPLMMEKRTKT